MNKRAVFVDRDGVLCEQKHLLTSKGSLKLLSGSSDAVRLLNEANFLVIVITNQPVVARGMCTIQDVRETNIYLSRMIQQESGGVIDAFYFCPHHPTEGNNPLYTRECLCRKPLPGMIHSAAKDYNISNLGECCMVGDSTSDIKAGRDAGCKTILVKTGYGGNDGWNDATPDFVCRNFYEAVTEVILRK